MPVVPGKPGTIRFRGRVRAQMQVGLAKVTEILNANTKYNALPVPPNPPLLSPLNLASMQAAQTAFQVMLATKNPG